ncbi:GNAT family N-acetyltransferase [bacterium]|nr:GNAT family N-acetyltransferase [bacterium]
MITTWTGERVRLRPFANANERCDQYVEMRSKPNQFWGAWWSARQENKKSFEESGLLSADKYGCFAVERLDTGELIGFEEHGFVESGTSAWIGTFIQPEHWHRGFGIEAKQLAYCYLFENFPLTSIDSGTIDNHVRAKRGLLESGMHFEGRIRRYHYIEGKYHDLVFYRIFREEWEQLPIRRIAKRGSACM